MSFADGVEFKKTKVGGIRKDKADMQDRLQIHNMAVSSLVNRQGIFDCEAGEIKFIFVVYKYENSKI